MAETATREEVERQIVRLNKAWQKYTEAEEYEYAHMMNLWNGKFMRICNWLGEHGYCWEKLPYDKETKTFSLPK